jgi:hypothetical protein
MKLISPLFSTVGRSVTFRSPLKFGKKSFRAIADKYDFLQVPTQLQDYDFSAGVQFLRGRFQSSIVDLKLYDGAVRAESSDGTPICDDFLNDLILTMNEVGANLEYGPLKGYSSSLECELDADFDDVFRRFHHLGEFIGQEVKRYGWQPEPYRGTGLTMMNGLDGQSPEAFIVEKRVFHSLGANIFYSKAPLSIDRHIEALKLFEQIMAGVVPTTTNS